MNVGGHDIDGARDGDDDDEQPEDRRRRKPAGVLLALPEEPPSVQTRRLAKFGEKVGGGFDIVGSISGNV